MKARSLIELARIFLKVLGPIELGGIDEDGHHYVASLFSCAANQRTVPFVQSAHGGDQADGQPALTSQRDMLAHFRNGAQKSHVRQSLREAARTHVVDIFAGRAIYFLTKLGVAFHKRRGELVEQAEHVVAHQNLSVAVGARADADGGNR